MSTRTLAKRISCAWGSRQHSDWLSQKKFRRVGALFPARTTCQHCNHIRRAGRNHRTGSLKDLIVGESRHTAGNGNRGCTTDATQRDSSPSDRHRANKSSYCFHKKNKEGGRIQGALRGGFLQLLCVHLQKVCFFQGCISWAESAPCDLTLSSRSGVVIARLLAAAKRAPFAEAEESVGVAKRRQTASDAVLTSRSPIAPSPSTNTLVPLFLWNQPQTLSMHFPILRRGHSSRLQRATESEALAHHQFVQNALR